MVEILYNIDTVYALLVDYKLEGVYRDQHSAETAALNVRDFKLKIAIDPQPPGSVHDDLYQGEYRYLDLIVVKGQALERPSWLEMGNRTAAMILARIKR